MLSFDSAIFGPFLGDPTQGEAITSVATGVPGAINLFELSLLEASADTCIQCLPPFLDELQPASFTLATLTFETLASGSALLDLYVNALGDGLGDPLPMDLIQGATVNVVGVPVPEPSSIALLATGLLGLAGLRKRRRRL